MPSVTTRNPPASDTHLTDEQAAVVVDVLRRTYRFCDSNQERLAEYLGTSQSNVTRWMGGVRKQKRPKPSLETAVALAKRNRLDLNELFVGDPERADLDRFPRVLPGNAVRDLREISARLADVLSGIDEPGAA